MGIATGAMNTLLPKLGELLVGEYKLQKGVKEAVEELDKELSSMNAALRVVSEVPADQLDELTKIWARDVRDLSYDIEDAIDIFMLRCKGSGSAETFSFKGFIGRATNLYKKLKTNHQIHYISKDIMDQVKKVRERHDRYKVDDVAARFRIGDAAARFAVTIDPRLEAMYREVAELVGIDGPKDELAKRLMEQGGSSPNKHPKIISIIGIGGLGKTTLANALFHSLKAMFDCHIFVSVSLYPDIIMILKNIFGQLPKKVRSQRDEEEYYTNEAWDSIKFISKIRELLKGRRYLCVIDDIWEESVWDTIKFAFEDGNQGSKIIITTRNKTVAEHAGGDVYELKPLCDHDSRQLFYKRIFDSADDHPTDLRKVTERILKKCGGVPLAIITISSLLASKPRTLQDWERVNKSIGSGLENSLDVDKMRKILSLSFYDLCPQLKACFLSLSKYPEDTMIRKDVFVWTWIAEGFITHAGQPAGPSLQEVGESYFSELINRSLIQPVDIHHYTEQDGQVHACQVHDMLLELINKFSVEEGFVTTILSDGQQAGACTSTVQTKKIRRLSLHYSNKLSESREPKEQLAKEQLSKVRSLTVFGYSDSIPPLSSFHVLRVLQLENWSLYRYRVNDLIKFHHLRFLRLRWDSGTATNLPESMGNLGSLETLDVRGGGVILLPMSFAKLQKLVCLFADTVRLPDGLALGNMKSLQEVVRIYFTPEVMEEIGNLKELRVLRILVSHKIVVDSTSNLVESIFMRLQRCTNFKDLDITMEGPISCSFDSMQHVPSGLQKFMSQGICMTAFPWWINSSTLSCLTTLSLELDQNIPLVRHLEKLAELPSLRFLRLHVLDYTELQQNVTVHSAECGFRFLRELYFFSYSTFLKFQPGSMPKLQRLCLRVVYHLERNSINDSGLENLQSLQHVIIKYITMELQAEVAVREALEHNPNHPSLELQSTTTNSTGVQGTDRDFTVTTFGPSTQGELTFGPSTQGS